MSGCSAWISPMAHSQKANGLVWGLSTRKIRTPWPIQKSRMSLQACHSSRADRVVGGPHVDRVDVLVLLGRVLGVLDGPVGPVVEPLGVVLRATGAPASTAGRSRGRSPCRATGPAPPGCRSRRRCRARGGGRCGRPLGVADGPRAARVVGLGGQGVVLALPEARPDGVDGWQVDDVEAHGGHGREPVGGALEAVFGGVGAGEELVPGADGGPFPVDPEGSGPRLGLVGRVGDLGQEGHQHRLEGGGEPALDRQAGVPQRVDGGLDPGPFGPVDPGDELFEEEGALLDLELDGLPGGSA